MWDGDAIFVIGPGCIPLVLVVFNLWTYWTVYNSNLYYGLQVKLDKFHCSSHQAHAAQFNISYTSKQASSSVRRPADLSYGLSVGRYVSQSDKHWPLQSTINLRTTEPVSEASQFPYIRTTATHSASSPHWGDLCTFRDTSRRIPSSGRPGARFPTADPRTRNSRWAMWRSTAGNCVAWCWRWGRWALVTFSCTRASSARKTHISISSLFNSFQRLHSKLFLVRITEWLCYIKSCLKIVWKTDQLRF